MWIALLGRRDHKNKCHWILNIDSILKMGKQLVATSNAAWFYLYQISKTWKYLVKSFFMPMSHVGYIRQNSFLIVLPMKCLRRLQIIQNASARFIMGLKKWDHITPNLKQLHWLPVDQRILFNMILLTFKSLHYKGPVYLNFWFLTSNLERFIPAVTPNCCVCPKHTV